jgi:FixJ family two-component response regulator
MSPVATIAIPLENAASLAGVPSYDLNLQRARNSAPVVFVIDGDPYVQESLELLIRSQGWIARTFESAQELLAWPRPVVPNCLILAYTPSRSSSIEVQKRIARQRPEMPIIVVSGYIDIPMTVQVIKAGAIDFLIKPFNSELLQGAIRQSLKRSRRALDGEIEIHNLWNRYELLTLRERQVLALVVSGLLNKQVGGELGISEITVKFHRGNLMRKMKAKSFAELVNMATRLRINGASGAKAPVAGWFSAPLPAA